MFCFPLTNWTTMRGASSVTSITQSESQWLDLQGFEDIVTWLEVKNVTLPGGATHVTLQYQTGTTKDEPLFASLLATAINLDTVVGAVTVSKFLMSSATIPLARWLRWQLAVTGAPSAAWDATFRLWIAANIGPHPLRPRINAPPLRPNGKSCNGDCQKGGTAPAAGMTMQQRLAQKQRYQRQSGGTSLTMAGAPPTTGSPTSGGKPGIVG
jgi:hypothetical protein